MTLLKKQVNTSLTLPANGNRTKVGVLADFLWAMNRSSKCDKYNVWNITIPDTNDQPGIFHISPSKKLLYFAQCCIMIWLTSAVMSNPWTVSLMLCHTESINQHVQSCSIQKETSHCEQCFSLCFLSNPYSINQYSRQDDLIRFLPLSCTPHTLG